MPGGTYVCILQLYQIYLSISGSVLSCLCVGVIEDIDMVASYTSAFVFCGVNNAVDHQLGAVRDHPRVNSYCVACLGDGAGTGVASPAFGADL